MQHSDISTECSTNKTKETECPNHSSQGATTDPKTSTSTLDTQTASDGSGRSEGSQRKSTGAASSKALSGLPDLSGRPRSSSSSPQFQVAEWNGHKHEEVPTTTSWVYLVQYVAGAEAWECTETDAMVFFSMPYSYKVWWQAHGRTDRLNTPFKDLHYYILWGGSVIEKGVREALKAKKSFNESAFNAALGLF
jgi:hypothetical protein